MRQLLFILFLSAFLSIPARDGRFVAHYDIKLAQVTCDGDCGFVQGVSADAFHDMNGVPYTRYRYNDDILNITWYVSDNAFNYNVVNMTDSVMTIYTFQIFARDWDNSPTRFGYSLEKPFYATRLVVSGKTFTSGLLIPLRNYPDTPLLHNTFLTKRIAEQRSRKMIGKKYQMLFPVYIGKKKYNYRFTFVVSGVSAITKSSDADDGQDEAAEENETAAVRDGEIEIFPLYSVEEKKETATDPKPSDSLTELLKRISSINYFNRLCPQEKVYLHLDNTAYFQGETIWYAANVVDAATGGEAASKVLYVELLSPTGVVLKQQKLKVTEGRCHGSFSLMDTSIEEAVALRGAVAYPSGYYQIRAYTRAMLNFDDAVVFSRVIPVYKASEKEGDYANPVMLPYSGKETYRPESAKTDRTKALNIQFFPEGGHLIADTKCRVAFKATDEHGRGITIDRIADAYGNLLSIPLQHNGMGSFVIIPDEKTQKVQVVYEGKSYAVTLPKPEPEGCTLRIGGTASLTGDQGKGLLTVTFAARGLPSTKLLAYTLTSKGRCHAADTLTIGRQGCTRTLATEKFPTGVYQLTLFDAEGAVYAQRLLFIDNGIRTETLSVTADKADIHPFERLQLTFQVNESTGQRVNRPATFSLAVRDAADYGTAYRDDIRTYMLLSSELKGLIEDPGWYFEDLPLTPPEGEDTNAEGKRTANGSNPITPPLGGAGGRLQALDLLMMVQGWTRYNWRQMAGVEPFEIRHYTEEQLVLDGWAFSRIKETPLADVRIAVRLTSQDRQQRQETTVTTDSLGYWSVGVEDFEGEWDLYMETLQKGDKKGDKTTRVRLERSSKPALYAYTPLEKWLPSYTWNPDNMFTVQGKEESEYQLPSDSHLLDEVEVQGRRKYIDFYTFKAFDAEKDAELMLDEGKYTYKVVDYLRDKGYEIQFPEGKTFEVFMVDWERDPEVRRLYPVMEDANDSNSISRTIYYQWVSEQAPINGFRSFWFVRDGKRDRTGPSYSDGYDMDLEEVKSIIVYDDPMMFFSFPLVRELMTNRLIQECFNMPKKELGFPAGLYLVEIELNPARKRRYYENKNARSTSFSGYTPVVEFYAPTYSDGPIQGDKDYRRTIYWNPEVTTDSTGCATVSFHNNGYSRALTISAEGLTSDGVPIINK